MAVDIDFYHEKDEQAFLDKWEAEKGSIEDIDLFYSELAEGVEEAYQAGTVKLGKKFVYQDVVVGYVDYNTFNNLFLFSLAKQ